MAFGLAITGHFINLIIFTSLIIIHELGHYLTARYYNYQIDKIVIYPYGGITKLNTKINTNIEKDLQIAISGPLIQCIYYLIIFFLYQNNLIREYTYNIFNLYHHSMIIFNLLPIYPLDGAKITNLLLSKYLNFNLSNRLTIIISLITIIIFLYTESYEKNYSLILTIGLLMENIYKFYQNLSHIYNRFIIERYLYNFSYKQHKTITNKDKMYKNKYHFFLIKGKLIEEKDYISNFFKKKP